MKNQKAHNFAVVAVAAMLLATVAASMATPDNAFAYKKNQAASQANACGNGEIPTNVGCQNTGSQIQGDENSVALAAQQTFPEVTPIPPVPPVPPVDECEECFAAAVTAGLNVEQFLANLNVEGLTSIELVCEALLAGELNLGQVVSAATQAGLSGVDLAAFIQCIQDILGIGGND
jgi:hypothetical protein